MREFIPQIFPSNTKGSKLVNDGSGCSFQHLQKLNTERREVRGKWKERRWRGKRKVGKKAG